MSKQKVIKDKKGDEQIMIRVDKTLQEMLNEKPSSRWDSSYWHPKYDELFSDVKKVGLDLALLGDFKKELTSGYRGALTFSTTGTPSIKVRNVLDTGLDLINVDFLPKNSPAISKNKKLKTGDIVLNRSGTGSIGRMTVFQKSGTPTYITGDVYRLALQKISPYYIVVVLKTFFCKMQIHRFETGVSGQTKIDLDEILHLKIPLLSNKSQKQIKTEYKKVSDKHSLAMKAKKMNEMTQYKRLIAGAKEELETLIIKTEKIIKGDAKDIS